MEKKREGLKEIISECELDEIENPEEMLSIIAYLGRNIELKYLPISRLNKLCYMAELRHIEEYRERMTEVLFLNWNFGPWSPQIQDLLDNYEGIQLVPNVTKTGMEGWYIVWDDIDDYPIILSPEKIKILKQIIREWKFEKNKKLIHRSKTTPPFIWTPDREQIDFDAYIECIEDTEADPGMINEIERNLKDVERGRGTILQNTEEIHNFLREL